MPIRTSLLGSTLSDRNLSLSNPEASFANRSKAAKRRMWPLNEGRPAVASPSGCWLGLGDKPRVKSAPGHGYPQLEFARPIATKSQSRPDGGERGCVVA